MTVFEDVFSDAQVALISAAAEYASGQVSDIFVYYSRLGGIWAADAFFVRQNSVVPRQSLPGVDVSTNRQFALLDALLDQVRRIVQAGKEFGRDIPVEGYLHYRVAAGSLDARYSSVDIPEGQDPRTDEKIAQWMEAVQKEIDTGRSD